MHIKNNSLPILLIILILSAALRVCAITYNPPSLNWDEISHGYNAYSLLTTGHDEWGTFLPLTNFRAYGDYPLPLNLYLTMPFIAVLGLNEFSIRLPHAILGILTVLASYYLAYGLTKRKEVGLITAFLMAVEPWTLFTSRFVLQSNLSVFFLTAALALFFNREKNKIFLPLSFLSLGLTLFSYHTTRIISPLILLLLIIIYKNEFLTSLKQKGVHAIISALLILIFFLPLPLILLNPAARARSTQVFVLDEGAVYSIEEERNQSQFPTIVSKFLYNRPVYFITESAKNYIQYFSPKYLFLQGGTQYQFSVPNYGLLYLITLPFFYLGMFLVIKKTFKGNKNYTFILLWFLIAPIAAAITKEDYAVLRSTPILPLPQIFTAFGFVFSLEWLLTYKRLPEWRPVFSVFFVFAILLSMEGYLMHYFSDYRTNYSWSWQYGYKEAIEYTKEHYNQYDQIIVSKKYGEPHEFFLFYGAQLNAPWDWQSDRYQGDPNLIRYGKSDWFWVDRFDKFWFVNDWQIPKSTNESFVLESGGIVPTYGKTLLVTSPANAPSGWKKLNTINFLDNTPAFEIYEN